MSDLLLLSIDASVFRNMTEEPGPCDLAQAAMREFLNQQLQVQNYIANNFVLAANAVGTAIPALPAAPYDGMLMIFTDISVRTNINGQGNQIVSPGGFVTMAATTTVTFTNDIVPPGELITRAANIRYFAVKLAPLA